MGLDARYLSSIPDAMVELYSKAETSILEDMARRISAYDYYIPAAQYQRQKLHEMGTLESDILKKLSSMTGKTQEELTRLLTEAGQTTVRDDVAYYTKADVYKPEKINAQALYDTLKAGLAQTEGIFENLTRTTANTATGQFERALDGAWLQVSTGAFSTDEAVTHAVKTLSAQGVGAVTYPSGRIDSLETAVRRAVVTGVNQTSARVQEELADELDIPLVEVTAHAGARPEHAVWQGGVYSRNGRVKINGVVYEDLRKTTGYGTGAGLCGWNCRHNFNPYVPGTARTWTAERLKALNKKSVNYNGQALTEYEASQHQRSIERAIRRWKRENAAMAAAGLDTTESAVKLKQWQETEKDFLRQTGFKRQIERESIAGWGRSQAARAWADAKKYEKALAEKQRYDTMAAELKKAGGLPKAAKVNIPPRAVSVADLSFDDAHINKERGHNVTRAQAEEWIQRARVSVTVWNGRYERYFSNAGAAYVDNQQQTIRTAFPAEQYDDKVKAILEVLDNYEKAR